MTTTTRSPAPLAAATRADWLRLAGRAGETAFVTYDGIRVEPLPLPVQTEPLGTLATRADADGWDIRAWHAGNDPKATRKAIADDLAGGATSLVLQLATPGQFGLAPRYEAIAVALQDVPLERIGVCFAAGDQYFGAAQCLLSLWDASGQSAASARGAIHADPLGTLAQTGALEVGLWPSLELLGQFVASNLASWPNVRLLLADGAIYHDAGASEAQELAAILASVVEYLRVMDYDGVAAADVFPRLSIGIAADCDLFLTIAKLRAARILLARVADACRAAHAVGHIEIWAKTSQRMLTMQAPHANSLRNVIAALGAAVGGADSITVRPHTTALGLPDQAARRLASRTHALLREESGIARVLDPAAGSVQIAKLTDALARRAWSLFQDIEAKGGMAKALLGGSVQDGIAKTAEKRAADLASGSFAITGVTAFAGPDRPAADRTPHPPVAPIERAESRIAAMPLRRLSEPYETC